MDCIFYKLVSPHSEDVTKNCRLTVNEIDSNFLNLKKEDTKAVGFDCEAKVLALKIMARRCKLKYVLLLGKVDIKFDVTFGRQWMHWFRCFKIHMD